MRRVLLAATLALGLAAAFGTPGLAAHPPGVKVPAGYSLKAAATGLDFPTAVAVDRTRLWVAEAGFLPGMVPKVKQIASDGSVRTILSATDLPKGGLLGPLTDVTFHNGWLWITHRQVGPHGWYVGAISRFRPRDPVATFQTVVTNLPASGDHYVEEIDFAPDGRAFFTIGSATNLAVVGPDNQLVTGWLAQFPSFHDFAPVKLRLSGKEYTSHNPLTPTPDDRAVTAPYMRFDSGPIQSGTVVPAATPPHPVEGMIAGNGTLYSFDPRAANPAQTLHLEAWGFRNPYGFRIDPKDPSRVFVTNNGGDIRSVKRDGRIVVVTRRPIAEDYDDLYSVHVGGKAEFFGWPDYFNDEETGEVLPITDDVFCESPLLPPTCRHQFVLSRGFRRGLDVQPALAQLEYHSSANKLDISTHAGFGFVGDLFVAETGSFVPVTGAQEFVGYRVVRVDADTFQVHNFIVNTGDTAAEIFDPDSFNKPIDVKFRGDVMVIVDFGIFEPGLNLAKPGTGKVWFVTKG